MEIVYLGLLSSIFNWVFNKILSPVFSFLSKLLESVLGWLFNNVLSPLLQEVLWPIFTGLLDLVYSVLAGILYTIFSSLLKIVDSLQTAFNLFAGLAEVTYKGEDYTLLELVFHLESVRNAFLLITMVGVVLAIMFSAIAVSRNIFELDTENARPMSKILGMTLRTMGKFLIVPFMALFLVMLSSRILSGIGDAMGGKDSSLARTVFVVASMDAAKNADYNITGSKAAQVGIDDPVRKDFYTGSKDYTNKTVVGNSFDFAKFDYLIGYGACIFLMVVLAICLFSFVSRIFDVIVLYIASPFFVSVMPLDDGEKFRAWQDMFFAKLFGGFGSVMAMQLYMMICPKIVGGSISFGEGTAEANYLIKLIFLLGGAWSVIKCGPMITQILNFQAGNAEREMGGFVAGAALSAGHSIVGGTERLVTNAFRSQKGAGAAAGGGTGTPAGQDGAAGGQKFTASPAKAKGNAIRPYTPRAQSPGTSQAQHGPGSGQERRSQISGQAPGQGQSSPGSGQERRSPISGQTPGQERRSPISGQAPGLGQSGSGSGQERRVQTSSQISGQGQRAQAPVQDRRGLGVTQSYFSGKVRIEKNADGKNRLGLHFGKAFTVGQDEQGRFRVSILGGGVRMGADGKVDKVTAPFVRWKRDDAGNFRVSKVKVGLGSRDGKVGNSVLGGLRFKREERMVRQPDGSFRREMGSMYFSDLSALSIKRRYDQETGQVEKIQMGTAHYEKENGQYHKAYSSFAGFRKDYGYTEDGTRYVKHRDWSPLHLKMDYQVVSNEGKTRLGGVYTQSGTNLFKRIDEPAAGAGKPDSNKEGQGN